MMRVHRLGSIALVAVLLVLPLSYSTAQAGGKGAGDPKGLLPPPKAWAAQVSPNEFTLVWARVASATGYEVLVRDAQGQLIRLGLLSASGSRFTVPLARLSGRGILLDGVQFAVRALGSGVQGPLSMFNLVSSAKQVSPKAPAVPGNAAGRETAPGVITVTWDAVEGATAYAIGRAAGTSGFQRFCDLCPTDPVLVDTVPTTGTHYVYSVTAITPGGRSRPAVTGRIEVTGLRAGGGAGSPGGSPADPAGGVAESDPKALAAGITVTPRVTGGARGSLVNMVLRLARRSLDQLTGQVTVLMRQVCDGPWIVVREVSLAQPVIEVEDAVQGIDAQCGTGKRSVRYQVRVSNAKGLVAHSPTGEVEVPTSVAAADTAATSPDPKGLAAGITVTPRVAGSGFLNSVVPIAVTIANRLGLGQYVGMATQLMRRVCGGPWVTVRSFSLSQPVIELEDAVSEIDQQCAAIGATVQYQVRISTAKGLVADSKAGTVTIPPVAPAATEPPATPGNRRMASTSAGVRTLMWDAVPTATSYRIERIAGAKGAWTVVQELPGTATSWVDTAKVDGTPQYRITAVNRAGHSASGSFR